MTASLPSSRRSAAATEGGRASERLNCSSSGTETSRKDGASSRRFHAMISVSLSDISPTEHPEHAEFKAYFFRVFRWFRGQILPG